MEKRISEAVWIDHEDCPLCGMNALCSKETIKAEIEIGLRIYDKYLDDPASQKSTYHEWLDTELENN